MPFYQIKDSDYTDTGLNSTFFSIPRLLPCYKYETINSVDIIHSKKAYQLRTIDQKTKIIISTTQHFIKVLEFFFMFLLIKKKKWTNTKCYFLILFCTNVTHMLILTNCIMTNLMIFENLDLLSLCVPRIIRILLAFSDFPTYSAIVLLPKFPLPCL